MTALYLVLYLLIFYYAYIFIMGVYRAHLKGLLKWYHYIILSPGLLFGYLIDILSQYTIAVVYFWDLPAKGEYLVTDRLQRYKLFPADSLRYKKSVFICENLLDIFDPTGNHC